MNKTLLLTLLYLLFFSDLIGQENSCSCASSKSLQFRTDYEKVFTPEDIKSQNITKAIVNMENSTSRYREMKFLFNSEGFVTAKTLYNRQGKPHSIYEYERNAQGLLVKQTFSYIDSLEQKTSYFSPEITDYSYNGEHVVKIKERSSKGEINPDEKSTYIKYQYDRQGRKSQRERQYYFTSRTDAVKYLTKWTYDDERFRAVERMWEVDTLFLTSKISYDSQWNPVKEDVYNHLADANSSTSRYSYDEKGRLTGFQRIAGEGSTSECPDNGTYTVSYIYRNELIREIRHSFEEVSCKMVFTYE